MTVYRNIPPCVCPEKSFKFITLERAVSEPETESKKKTAGISNWVNEDLETSLLLAKLVFINFQSKVMAEK